MVMDVELAQKMLGEVRLENIEKAVDHIRYDQTQIVYSTSTSLLSFERDDRLSLVFKLRCRNKALH
jgi:hypothetical protein